MRLCRVFGLFLSLALLAVVPASAAWSPGQKVASGSAAVAQLLASENLRLSAERAGENIALAYEIASGSPVAARGAFEVAKAGGKHVGFLRNYVGRTPAEIQKAIASIEKQIADHRPWIANPQSKIPNFGSLDPRQQAALVNSKWPGDIARQKEQLEILRGLLGGT